MKKIIKAVRETDNQISGNNILNFVKYFKWRMIKCIVNNRDRIPY